jgi:hypothetical protein
VREGLQEKTNKLIFILKKETQKERRDAESQRREKTETEVGKKKTKKRREEDLEERRRTGLMLVPWVCDPRPKLCRVTGLVMRITGITAKHSEHSEHSGSTKQTDLRPPIPRLALGQRYWGSGGKMQCFLCRKCLGCWGKERPRKRKD